MTWENGKKHKKYRKEWVFLKHQIENLVFKEIEIGRASCRERV